MSQSFRFSIKIFAGPPFLDGPNRTDARRPGFRPAIDETGLAALALAKEISVMISKGLSGDPGPEWTFRRTEKSLTLAVNRNLDRQFAVWQGWNELAVALD